MYQYWALIVVNVPNYPKMLVTGKTGCGPYENYIFLIVIENSCLKDSRKTGKGHSEYIMF